MRCLRARGNDATCLVVGCVDKSFSCRYGTLRSIIPDLAQPG